MNGPACVVVEGLPQRRRDIEAPLDRSDWVPKRDRSRLGSQYRLGAGKTSPVRVNAVLRTKACETKPIPPRAKRRASTLQKRSYDELDTQQASAKQSQFPRGQQWARAGKPASPPVGPVVRNKANFRHQADAMGLEQTMASPFDFAQSLPRATAKQGRPRAAIRPRMPVAPWGGPGGAFFLPASQQMDIIRPRMTTQRRPEPPQAKESIHLEVWP